MTEKTSRKHRHMLTTGNRHLVIGIFGICLALFGAGFGLFWEQLFNVIVEQNLILQPGSLVYNLWQAPPMKTVLDIYLFNWTNPEDFHDPAIKPKLQELGPYRFIELAEKVDIEWHNQNASVSFRKRSHYYFDAAGSRGSLKDRIVTLNSLAVTASTQARRFSPMRRTLTELALMTYSSDLTIRKTANEMLFGGFDDMLLDMASMLPKSISEVAVPFDKYGYYYGRNGSSQFLGNFNIYTGRDDITKLGQMNTWNYKTYTKSYPSECSKIYGSAGEFQGPHMPVNGTVNIFLPELCRHLPLEYDGQVDVDGVLGYKYIGGPRSMDNGSLYPENVCYCNGECVPSGVLNVTSCLYDSPIFISYPHFYNADPSYLLQIDGLKPEKEKHQFEYIIEPKTSVGLDIVGRTQVNQLIEPMPHSRMFRDVRRIFFPLFWLESKTRLTTELLDYFRPLPTYVLCGRIFGGFCLLVGLILAFWQPIVQYSRKRLMQQLENADFEHGKECLSAKASILSRESGVYLEKEQIKGGSNKCSQILTSS